MLQKIDDIFYKNLRITPLSVLLLLVLVLRLPTLFEPYWYGDEAIYLTLGNGIRNGLLLYRDIFDHKPPLIYIIAAIANSQFWFKFILLVWNLASIILFSQLANKLFSQNTFPQRNKKKAIILATWIFGLLTTLPTLEGNIANAEVFLVGPVLAGFLYIWNKQENTKTLFIAGLIFSLAVLFKIPAIFEVFALVAYWAIQSFPSGKELLKVLTRSLVLGITIAFPFLLLAAYYALHSAITPFLQGIFSQNLGYIASWSTPQLGSGSFLSGGLPARGVILLFLLATLLVAKKLFDKLTLFAVLWFIFTIFAMLLSGRPYPHYIIQVIAPLGILLGILSFGAQKYRFLAVPFLIIFLFALNFYKFEHYQIIPYYKNFFLFAAQLETRDSYFQHFDQKTTSTYKIASFLEENTSAEDRVFIWGTMPEVYALSHRLPPTRYIVSFHIKGFQGEDETLNQLKANPPLYLLSAENTSFAGLSSFLQKNYVYSTTLDRTQVWRRLSPKLIKYLQYKP